MLYNAQPIPVPYTEHESVQVQPANVIELTVPIVPDLSDESSYDILYPVLYRHIHYE